MKYSKLLKSKNEFDNKKRIKNTKLVKNYKGFFQKKKKIISKKKNEDDINESDFFKKMKEMMVLNLKREHIINYFQKDRYLRAEIETRSVADYLSSDKKNVFFNLVRKISVGKLYNLVHNLFIDYYKKGDLIFQYKEPMSKFSIILEGTISLYLPYFLKKFITVKEFLNYLFYVKKNFPKSFNRVEKKNENLFDGIYKLKLNEYNMNCFTEDEENRKQDFFIEEYQNVYNINEGNQVNLISILYNLVQNFNGYAKTDVYILTLNRSDFMNILRIGLEEELSKDFIRLRKYCYIFNSWNNYSLAQIINYYIPIELINEELLFKQKDESDSFYIVQDGIFEVYCEISVYEFHQYKKYILKDNKNIIEWIKEEKEIKSKITVEKIIDYIQWKLNKEKYPQEKAIMDKNMLVIKKNLLHKGEETDEKLINLKVNEDILKEKNKKIKIKLFTLQKNDFIGLEDSIELKSRFYNVKCVSERGTLNKIRILDFILFISSNHGLELQNINNYIKERKNTIIERIYNILTRELNNNQRTINNAYSIALSSYEKRKKLGTKNKTENNYNINFIKKVNNNNFINKMKQLIQNNSKVSDLLQGKDINLNRKKSAGVRRFLVLNKFFGDEEKKNNMPKLQWDFRDEKSKSKSKSKDKSIIRERNKFKNQPNISLNQMTTSSIDKNSNKNANINTNRNKRIKDLNSVDKIHFKSTFSKNNNFDNSNKTIFKYNLTTTTLNDNLYKIWDTSYNSKLDKEIINFTGIYNTKREVQKKKLSYPSEDKQKKGKHIFNNYRVTHPSFMYRKKSNNIPMVALLSITDMNERGKIKYEDTKTMVNLRKYKNLKYYNDF